jgi:hypothetical protein
LALKIKTDISSQTNQLGNGAIKTIIGANALLVAYNLYFGVMSRSKYKTQKSNIEHLKILDLELKDAYAIETFLKYTKIILAALPRKNIIKAKKMKFMP